MKSEKLTKLAFRTMIGSGILTLGLGVVIWVGDFHQLDGVHELFAYVLVLSLWTLCFLALRSGISIGLVSLAVVWSLAAIALGGAQEELVTGGWHWTIQVLHLIVGMGMLGFGQRLAYVLRRHGASASAAQLRHAS